MATKDFPDASWASVSALSKSRSLRAPFTHAGDRAFGKPPDGSADVSTDSLHRLRRAPRLRYYGQSYPSCAARAQ